MDIDAIQARHRKELKELQGRITNKKKNATKKTRKGINEECAAMEREMKEKHAEELRGDGDVADGVKDEKDVNGDGGEGVDGVKDDKDVNGDGGEAGVDTLDVTTKLADTSLQQKAPSPSDPPSRPKKNRQKERMARRAAQQEQLQQEAAAEAANMVDHAAVERDLLAPLIKASGRAEHVIRPDGHCLFSAVADQLWEVGRTPSDTTSGSEAKSQEKTSSTSGSEDKNNGEEQSNDLGAGAGDDDYRIVRRTAARYMESHPDDFAPFLAAYYEDCPDLATHVARIRDTAEWGGQLELLALASAYGVTIRVLHDGRWETINPAGEEDPERPTLWLVYYRHGFGLGEHYNSLRAKKA